MEVRGSHELLDGLEALLSSSREELLIGFGQASFSPGWLLLVDDCYLVPDHEVRRDANGLHWTGELTSKIYAEARRSSRGVLLVHAHGGRGLPHPSKTDRDTADKILNHFGGLLPESLHAYLVLNRSQVAGWLQLGGTRHSIELLRVASWPIRRWPSTIIEETPPLARDDRQARALGATGVAVVRRSSIGIVGLGGAGSQVVEMLAHAGAGRLVLADADVVKDVNLSRTHGTSPELIGQSKVAIARQMAVRIASESEVIGVKEAFPSRSLLMVLRDVDIIIACVDNPLARSELNRFSLRYAIPFIDLGTTITAQPFRVDGHLSVIVPGSHCLRCLGHVSDAALEEEAAAARIGQYGLNDARPQVVSFNALLASAAVTEALKLLTGFAGASRTSKEWHYNGISGELREIRIAEGRCNECQWYSNKADAA